MRILWTIHLYPPKHNCGSEYMAHFINKFLQSKGHEVRVVLLDAKRNKIHVPYTFDGIEVFGPSGSEDQFRWADIIFTHLDYTHYSVEMGRIVKRPVVHFVHNDTPYQSILNSGPNTHVVYNSKWIAKKLAYDKKSCVLYPPCDPDYYNVCPAPEKNKYIALINLNENKGIKQFYEIAKEMPDKQFLGIKGSYCEQIVEDLPNVTIVENTSDIRKYYKDIRILLMPSEYESWGRTATEAMANGIPVIFNWTSGLNENIGPNAGIAIQNRDDIDLWVKKIKALDNKKTYQAASNASRSRAAELWQITSEQLENFHTFISNL